MTSQQPQIRPGTRVLQSFIDATDQHQAVERILNWGAGRQSRTVCLCNVHSAVTALDDPRLAKALESSDMVLPDGAPVAWVMRRKGHPDQRRIAGPDLMWALCQAAEARGPGVFLFGSTPETLDLLESNLRQHFPGLDIRGTLSPRFGDWTEEEAQSYIETINGSGAGLIFVGLGCPKQEIWMAANKERINGVLLGVGAAFDFHAGVVERAPLIFQRLGLEWLHRLLSEPRRLWRRYLVTNSRFLYFIAADQLPLPSKKDRHQ